MVVDKKEKKIKRGKSAFDNNDYQEIARYEKGKSFEQKVGEIFELMGFDVEFNRERETAGNEIDIFLKKRKSLGNRYEYYVCECKNWSKKVGKDIINKFNFEREGVKKKLEIGKLARDCEAVIISLKGFTEPAKEAADTFGIILYTYDELLSQLMNFRRFLTTLIQNFKSDPLAQLYIEQDFKTERSIDKLNITKFVEQWLKSPDRKQFFLLGDYGTGKTSFARRLAYIMAKAYKKEPLKNRIPFLVNLRKCERPFNLRSFLYEQLKSNEVKPADAETFLKLLARSLSENRIII